ncbi:MAG TPA: M56 family metallopeptidase [Puia sp.]|nr:M56 family metallopeptidase [Puia sp.]
MTTINITQALCLTLIHSLWQGFLAAVAAGIIILCTKRSKAAVRYNLLTADLVLFLLATAFTFFYELGGGSGPSGAVSAWVAGKVSGLEETAVPNGIALQVHSGVGQSTGILHQVGNFLTLHASTVVLVWMLCLLGQLVQLMGGLYRVGWLRRRRVFDPGTLWQERLQALAVRLGVGKTVALIQSAYVRVPVTFGFLKPSILVPLGMLTNLPADQVETILLHELAHIRRNDYLANLLLHITEALFFFNPGLRWIASLIREEREACCDDMVLNTADRTSYFEALVAFGENSFARQGYALPLSKGKTDLLWRIRRMLNQENKNLHIMEKAILIFGLTAILAIGLISMRAAEQQADKRQTTRQPARQGTDTVPKSSANRVTEQFPSISTRVEDNGATKQYKIDATDVEGNTFQLTKVNGAVTELVINGKSIPEKDFDQYLYIFDEIENRHHETAGEQEGEDKVALAERELAKAQERLDAANQEQADVQQRLEEQQERQQEAVEQEAERKQEAAEQEAERKQEAAEQAQEKLEQDQERKQDALEKQQEATEQEAERKQEAAEQQAERQQEAVEKQQEAYEKQQEAYGRQEETRNAADRAIHQIVSDMIDLGLVGSREDVHSFTLDNNGLILNGVQQSADAYQTLRRKYIGNAAEHYIYSHNGSGTTFDVKQK